MESFQRVSNIQMIQTIEPHYYACQTNNTIVNVDQELTQMMVEIRKLLEKYNYNSIIVGIVK